jgi:hypothetical protein
MLCVLYSRLHDPHNPVKKIKADMPYAQRALKKREEKKRPRRWESVFVEIFGDFFDNCFGCF